MTANAADAQAPLQEDVTTQADTLRSVPQETVAVQADHPTSVLHVMTVNIHKGFTALNRKFILPELREAVRAVSADVVFLQEVLGTHSRHAGRLDNWPEAPHYEFLADTMWPQYAYGRNAVYPSGHHGNALLSKFPIVHYRNHDISIAGPEKRGLLHAVLRTPGGLRDVHAICVHLSLQESHRLEQLHLLCHLVRDEVPDDAPLIVAGDFNDWRRRAHDVLEQEIGLHEVFKRATGQAARTFPARWPLLQLDRIYVRGASVHSPRVLPRTPWSHLSDHAPLCAEIHL
ncbi:MAG: endonuclease/exonuclease/phosphatase family protein [Burkholderiales bacterium]|jgi:endonuclease/exonuclease/phosphatase family metal-dependent hydrolase|nr:endonuclease/exonuclease/phosphatase family protein [Burkholderiales bacterium]